MMLALLVSWLLALPFTTPKYEVTVERNVPYATAQGYYSHTPVGERKAILKLLFHSGWMNPITLEMDIYLPEGDLQETRPLLLMMHGGAFFIGNKEELGQVGWCRYFASLGYVAASINYRLGFHPEKKEGREDLRIDPEHVFLAGTSAGAITALHLDENFSFTPRFAEIRDAMAAFFATFLQD